MQGDSISQGGKHPVHLLPGHVTQLANTVFLLVAVAMQILVTLPLGDTGIRTSLSDLFLPFLVILYAYSFMQDNGMLLRKDARKILAGFTLVSLWFVISIINGRYYTGGWQLWGLINKGAGWIVLMAYFITGALFWANSREDARYRFIKLFLITGWLVAAYELTYFVLNAVALGGIENTTRSSGLVANSNSYGLLTVVLILLQAPFFKAGKLFPKYIHYSGMTLLFFALVLSVSRCAWFGFLCGFVTLVWFRCFPAKYLVYIVSSIILAGIILVAVFSVEDSSMVNNESVRIDRMSIDLRHIKEKWLEISGGSIMLRMQTARSGLEQWSENPVLGIGLGSFYWSEVTSGKRSPLTLHNTFLWLLVEMGLVGIIIFGWLFAVCITSLWQRANNRENSEIQVAALAVMAAASGTSVGMEVLYQRHLWLILGCSMAVCLFQKRKTDC